MAAKRRLCQEPPYFYIVLLKRKGKSDLETACLRLNTAEAAGLLQDAINDFQTIAMWCERAALFGRPGFFVQWHAVGTAKNKEAFFDPEIQADEPVAGLGIPRSTDSIIHHIHHQGSEIGIGERKRGRRGGVHHFHTDLIPERCLKGSVQMMSSIWLPQRTTGVIDRLWETRASTYSSAGVYSCFRSRVRSTVRWFRMSWRISIVCSVWIRRVL